MKVLYISYPYFFDMDLSLVQHLSKKAEVTYLLDLPVYARKSSALEITKQPESAGIKKLSDFPEMKEFYEFIDPAKTWVINRTSKKVYAGSNLKLQGQIKKFVKKIKPDIIHCNSFLTFDFFRFLLSNRYPIVQTVHDPFPHSGENSYRDFAVRRLNYSFIEKKILLNFKQKEEFIQKNNFDPSDIYTTSLGPYTHLKRFPVKEPENKQTKNILFFGRISEYKGIEYLIRAVKRLVDELPDIKLTIAGKGEFWFDIKDIRDSENFRIINDYISTPKLVELLNENELVACPYTDATQSGVIMTAYAFCKPVVATNVGGLAEMVEDGVTGKLVSARNVKELAEAIKELLSHPEKVEEMKINIQKQYFEGSHSWDSRADELVGIYRKIISNTKR